MTVIQQKNLELKDGIGDAGHVPDNGMLQK
jgi:hypothetical protein